MLKNAVLMVSKTGISKKMEFTFTELLGWLAFLFLLIGYYLNSKIKKSCFYFWGIGNIFYTIYGLSVDAKPIIATSILILFMNFYGFINWKKIKENSNIYEV